MSRSKRLVGVADATPLVWFAAACPFHMLQRAFHIPVFCSHASQRGRDDPVLGSPVRAVSCCLRPSRPHQQFLKTAVNVKLLLPPRQSRGSPMGR